MQVKVSPFDGNLLAVAAAQNFGLKGSGRLFILARGGLDAGAAQKLAEFDFPDGMFDVAWSEVGGGEEVVVGGGDGRVWRVNWRTGARFSIPAHSREISSVDWCPHRLDKFCSSGWDNRIVLVQGGKPVAALNGHSAVVNEARWSPHSPSTLISASADRTVRLWDDRKPGECAALIAAPQAALFVSDFLCVDINKYEDWHILAATTSDLLSWDARMLGKGPLRRIPQAHRRAIKRVRWSPWTAHHLATASFDMSVRLWDTRSLNPLAGPAFSGFTEFATGLDWSNFERNVLISCSWDETIREHFVQ